MQCLCPKTDYPVVCTNRCPERSTCDVPRTSFLIHVICLRFHKPRSEECYLEGIYPEAYTNDLVEESVTEVEVLDRQCQNPTCNNSTLISRPQIRHLIGDHFRRYGVFPLIFCSKECQERSMENFNNLPSATPTIFKTHGEGLKVCVTG